VLRLFAGERSEWTVEAAAQELGLPQSTAYQYFRSLVESGLLSSYKTGRYVVGPAIIELDRQARRHDPLILAAREQMDALTAMLNGDDVVLLCRLYKFTVMCVDQRAPAIPRQQISYERGRPMPLERGSASKVILAHLPPRTLRRYYNQMYGTSGNPSWEGFRQPLREIRKAGLCISHGELDQGRVGVSAAIFADGEIVGSIGLVLTEASVGGTVDIATQKRVITAGEQISAALSRVN
jgi:DNA-binding IclR family transcriptional regulator